jgi:FAD/FMN-containing dehydrogenase
MTEFDPVAGVAARISVPVGFQGEFLTPGDEGYEEARIVFNRRLSLRPAVIAKCSSVADVQGALRVAREHGLPIAVRGGGHSGAGWSTIEGGLVVDLRPMRSVRVDPDTRTAWVSGGSQAMDLLAPASKHGLVPSTGLFGSIGLGGLLLGLGEGWLTPKYGYGNDSIEELEVVTAAGELLRVAADSHPDLFWAMRGAGANFGVVTAMKLRLHPLPEQVVGGNITIGEDGLRAATDYFWDFSEHGSRDSWLLGVYRMPEDGRPLISLSPGHIGPREEAARDLADLRGLGVPVSDTLQEMSYLDLINTAKSEEYPPRYLWDAFHFEFGQDPEPQKQLVLALQPLMPPGAALVLWRTVPVDQPVPSVARRLPGITFHIGGHWHDPAEDEMYLRWGRETTEAILASGLVTVAANTVNHVSSMTNARVRDLYGPADYTRLASLKAVYDPENTFRSNANIPPVT